MPFAGADALLVDVRLRRFNHPVEVRPAVFDLFDEPCQDRADARATDARRCWRDGGTCPGVSYEVAGMQDLVDAVRGAGAKNVVMAGGFAYSNDLSQWLAYKPADPAGNLAAAYHVDNFNACVSAGCWNSTLAPVAAQVPLVAGEIGEDICSHSFTDQVMKWFDDHSLSCPGPDLEHLGLLLRSLPDLRLRRHTHRVRRRAA